MATLALNHLIVALLSIIFVVSCVAELCPDHRMRCRKGQTCCDNKESGYACCPYSNASCCADGLHCCPEDTTCDLAAGRCRRSKTIQQVLLVPADNTTEIIEFAGIGDSFVGETNDKKQCPDQKQSCPSTYTCCKDPEDGYACCPFSNATCCSDFIHCCPEGKKCGNGKCI